MGPLQQFVFENTPIDRDLDLICVDSNPFDEASKGVRRPIEGSSTFDRDALLIGVQRMGIVASSIFERGDDLIGLSEPFHQCIRHERFDLPRGQALDWTVIAGIDCLG